MGESAGADVRRAARDMRRVVPICGREEILVVDGHPLRVVRHGEGPPLLLLNGIGASAEMWAPVVPLLPGHGLIAVDLPGAGSSPPAPRPLRIRALARLAVQLLDALAVQRADVLGYSFGGTVAQELARRAPGRVRRLVLCATSIGWTSLPPRPRAAMMMLTPARYNSPAAAQRIVPVIAGGRTRRNAAALERHISERFANPPSRIGYFQQLYASTGWTSLPWLWRVRHRTLIVHGDDDPLVPVINARTMASLMDHATLRVIRGGGHLFLFDEPESVVDGLLQFLEAV